GELPPRHESTIRPKRGRERRIAWANTTMRGVDGRAVGTSSLGLDITDRLELEAMQLQNRKVESLGRMAAHVAHDFNNLLTVIRGAAEDLASSDEAARKEALPEIDGAIHQATELTRALLDYGRASTQTTERQPLDGIVRGALPILRRMAQGQVELGVDLGADDAEVEIDPNQLRQVLVNLVTNAVDATRGHGRLVRVTTRVVELGIDDALAAGLAEAGGYAIITVSDDGTGLSETIRARMFEPFFTTKEPGRGTGLGLALCDSIVRRVGGAIVVHSEPGRGATFDVHLPLAGRATTATVAPAAETI
ncbi:MAG: HAMP domain-containing sensor histidine kinase, partial [Myxococcota bacterium]